MTASQRTRRQALAHLARLAQLAPLGGMAALAATRPSALRAQPATKAPYWVGVSGPLTGAEAQYGQQWQRGFDLALAAVNSQGGIDGHPVRYQFEDSRSDPRQSVAIAQKFVADPKILIELGDFASGASMAASPIYERGRLVQFGFTNSHPDFTKGGQYMWSTAISQAEEQPLLARHVVDGLGLRRPAVLYLNNDFGRTSSDIFAKAAAARGAHVVSAQAYQREDQDFRAVLVKAREARPDGLVLVSYYADAARIVRQARQSGWREPIASGGAVYSPKFLELGGASVEGVLTQSSFFPAEDRAEVRDFVQRYRAAYGLDPDTFAAASHDAMNVVIALLRKHGPDRQAIQQGFATLRDVPSVIYGRIAFDAATRRAVGLRNLPLVVRNGRFELWQGKGQAPQRQAALGTAIAR